MNPMKYLFFVAFFYLLSCTKSELPSEFKNEVERRVDIGINNGIAIATIDSTGRVNYYNFGHEGDFKTLVNENSTFQIASISKTFTSTLILNMEKTGKLSLNQEIRDFIPDSLPESIKRIAFQELINHTSGLPRLPHDFWVDDWDNPYVDYSEEMFLFDLNIVELDSTKKWEYSNFGYMLLGSIITKMREDVQFEHFFEELKLKNTFVGNKTISTLPYNFGKQVKYWDFQKYSNYIGGIKSSSADLMKYLQYQMEQNPVFSDYRSKKDVIIDEKDSIYCRGGWLVYYRGNEEIIWHDGMSGGYNSFIGYNTKRKTGIVILTNTQALISDLGLSYLSSAFEIKPAKLPLINEVEKLIQMNNLDSMESLWNNHDTLKYQKNWGDVYWLQCHYISKKEYKIALKLCDILIAEMEDDWEVYFYRGKIYELMRNNELVIENYRKAHELFPSNNFLESRIEFLKN
jgi:CubicO group peptidase (beta-lactamase class C family)